MKLALFGAGGHIGRGILSEALARGHHVVAIVRDVQRAAIEGANVTPVQADVADPATYTAALSGVDATIASLSARRDSDASRIPRYAATLLDALSHAQVARLVWVGGAGSLETAPGVRLVDDVNFPAAWKAEALAQSEALQVFRNTTTAVNWTYVSPAALIEDGARTGTYRLGGDQLLVDAQGNSRISVADYAVAILDRIERNDRPRQRITVAY